MATSLKRIMFLRPVYLLGLSLLGGIILLYTFSLQAVFNVGLTDFNPHFWQDNYLQHVLFFTFYQALLSAFLSLGLGFLVARAFYYQDFPFKNTLLRFFSLTFVLPALVVVFGLLGIYGHSGIMAKISQYFALPWGNFYGLTGILTAHCFFNLPLATRLCLQAYQSIPSQEQQLAAQLNLQGWYLFRFVEFPTLRATLSSTFVLIFMLCFTSFTLVLSLGGSPKYTTLEVAIYQAIFFDFELSKAALFALLQFFCCFLLFTISSLFTAQHHVESSQKKIWLPIQSRATKIGQIMLILLSSLFILSPLLYTFFSALNPILWLKSINNPDLWQALFSSLILAFFAATLALTFTLGILFCTRRLNYQGYPKLAQQLVHSGMVILAIPTLVLALGLFLLLRQWQLSSSFLWLMVIFCNALMALPFALRILNQPMQNLLHQYEKLSLSLGLSAWQRFRLVEWRALQPAIRYAFALSACLSLGDFTAIAFFANANFTSLPHLLYQQLARYQMQEANITAVILLFFCTLLFFWVEKYDSTRSSI